jgi:ParB/RepB/Spo0J family partition protein
VRYEIVAGERRWQAAKLAGLADIPVVVREVSRAQVVVALIENIQREELTPAEEARALVRLIARAATEADVRRLQDRVLEIVAGVDGVPA